MTNRSIAAKVGGRPFKLANSLLAWMSHDFKGFIAAFSVDPVLESALAEYLDRGRSAGPCPFCGGNDRFHLFTDLKTNGIAVSCNNAKSGSCFLRSLDTALWASRRIRTGKSIDMTKVEQTSFKDLNAGCKQLNMDLYAKTTKTAAYDTYTQTDKAQPFIEWEPLEDADADARAAFDAKMGGESLSIDDLPDDHAVFKYFASRVIRSETVRELAFSGARVKQNQPWKMGELDLGTVDYELVLPLFWNDTYRDANNKPASRLIDACAFSLMLTADGAKASKRVAIKKTVIEAPAKVQTPRIRSKKAGAIYIGPDFTPGCVINVCEGLETALSVYQLLGPDTIVACCLNTAGLTAYEPPFMAGSVVIWADNDLSLTPKRVQDAYEYVDSNPGLDAAFKLKQKLDGKAPEVSRYSSHLKDVLTEEQLSGFRPLFIRTAVIAPPLHDVFEKEGGGVVAVQSLADNLSASEDSVRLFNKTDWNDVLTAKVAMSYRSAVRIGNTAGVFFEDKGSKLTETLLSMVH